MKRRQKKVDATLLQSKTKLCVVWLRLCDASLQGHGNKRGEKHIGCNFTCCVIGGLLLRLGAVFCG